MHSKWYQINGKWITDYYCDHPLDGLGAASYKNRPHPMAKRCNEPAFWIAKNGYCTCDKHRETEMERIARD